MWKSFRGQRNSLQIAQKKVYYWPRIKKDLTTFVRKYEKC